MMKKVILFCCNVSCLFLLSGMDQEIIRKQQLKYLPLSAMEKRNIVAAQLHLLHNNKKPNNNCRYPTSKNSTEKK